MIETVLNGKHYYRSLAGFLIIEDLVICLQWRAFWHAHNKDDYPFLPELESLAKSLSENQVQGEEFELACRLMKPLKQDFDRFIKVCEERSQVCKYLGIFLCIVGLMKNIVVSDREGYWDLHAATVD